MDNLYYHASNSHKYEIEVEHSRIDYNSKKGKEIYKTISRSMKPKMNYQKLFQKIKRNNQNLWTSKFYWARSGNIKKNSHYNEEELKQNRMKIGKARKGDTE